MRVGLRVNGLLVIPAARLAQSVERETLNLNVVERERRRGHAAGLEGPAQVYQVALFSTSTGAARPRVWPFYFVAGSLLGGGLYVLGREDAEKPSNAGFPMRAWQRLTGFFTSLEAPAFEKLLPDPIVDPQNPRPYTLVIDLDKFLVCHLWDREQGRWRIAKRPGAELFLFYAAQLYEVVVFSSLPQHEGDVIVKKLDPYGCISYSLYRFATTHKHGTYLKDISHLNRDPAKVLVLGHDVAGFAPHPENFIRVEPWTGAAQDTVLEDSIDFLEMLAFSGLKDVRPVAQQYDGKVFPEAFQRAQEASFAQLKQLQKTSIQGRISSLFSFGRSSKTPADSGSALGGDANGDFRARKQERLELRRKEYARIKDLMQKQLEAEMQKEKEYYAEHKMALWDLFSKGPPPPPPPPPKQ